MKSKNIMPNHWWVIFRQTINKFYDCQSVSLHIPARDTMEVFIIETVRYSLFFSFLKMELFEKTVTRKKWIKKVVLWKSAVWNRITKWALHLLPIFLIRFGPKRPGRFKLVTSSRGVVPNHFSLPTKKNLAIQIHILHHYCKD